MSTTALTPSSSHKKAIRPMSELTYLSRQWQVKEEPPLYAAWMASSEVDQKFLGHFAKTTTADNNYLSSFLFKVLGLSVILAEQLLKARRAKRLDPKVLSYKLRASFLHIFVLFHNDPPLNDRINRRTSGSFSLFPEPLSPKLARSSSIKTPTGSRQRSPAISLGGPVGGPTRTPPGLPYPPSYTPPTFLLPLADYRPQATAAFKEANDLADRLLPGSHPVRLSVKVEYVAYIYDCLHEAERSRYLAKMTIRQVYEAQEGMDDESFEDAAEMVGILGRMMKRGLGTGGSSSSQQGATTAAAAVAAVAPNGGGVSWAWPMIMTDDSGCPISTVDVDVDNNNAPELDITRQAIEVFLAARNDNGSIAGIGYWQVANGYTAIVLHELWSVAQKQQTPAPTPSPSLPNFVSVVQESFEQIESTQPGFINEYNDDSMWWAMANLELFTLTNEAVYLEAAYRIWSHVKQYRLSKGEVIFRGMDMEGAVYWTTRDNETQLNTITTGLFAELSARLAGFCTGPDYDTAREQDDMISLAQGSLAWILRCRFDPQRNLKDWTFTYTTGQTIAASVAIHKALVASPSRGGEGKDADFLALACDLAQSAMHRHHDPAWVDLDGTLSSAEYPGQDNSPWDNNDAVGFKSILLRSLAKLRRT
ncbi:hypothetical protein DV738_g631, partial [Chaetothyriales sp. CBS 135597]